MLLQLLASVPILALLYALVVCAWQCDDAYITFRTVRNFWSGFGLTWNPDQRVQAYTHPLWMFLSLAVYGVTRELFFSLTLISILLTLEAALALGLLTRNRLHFAATVLVLACSYAFIDFSVCGLENPLLNALLVGTILVTRADSTGPRPLLLGLSLSGVFLTRADAVLLIAPLWAAAAWEARSHWRRVLLALAPIALWELFSLVYYGLLVPNTAVAKLNLDISPMRLSREGVRYLGDSLQHDPITLIATGVALGYAAWRGDTRARLLGAGAGLYLLYVVRIGGDFMSGRFLGAPLLIALCAANLAANNAAPSRAALRVWAAAVVIALGYSAAWSRAPLRSTLGFGRDYNSERIADERAVYYRWTGLLPALNHYGTLLEAGMPIPWMWNVELGRDIAASKERVFIQGDVGYVGFNAGDKVIIDPPGLADPLLARIRFHPPREGFRVGHYDRPLPKGYVETRASGRNQIERQDLRDAYDAIDRVVRGPLFTQARARAIWRLNTGGYDAAFDAPN